MDKPHPLFKQYFTVYDERILQDGISWLPVHELTEDCATFHSFSKHLLSTYRMLGTVTGPGDRSSLKTRACPQGNQETHISDQCSTKLYLLQQREKSVMFHKEPREKLGVKGHCFGLGGLGHRENAMEHREFRFLPMSKPQRGKHKIPWVLHVMSACVQRLLPFELSIWKGIIIILQILEEERRLGSHLQFK